MFAKLWMKIKVIYKDRWSFWLSNFSLFFLLISFVLFFSREIVRSPIASLHYNIYAGIDFLGDWRWLLYLPILMLFLSIINFIIAAQVFTKKAVYSHFILTLTLSMNLMFFVYYFYILNYNLNA